MLSGPSLTITHSAVQLTCTLGCFSAIQNMRGLRVLTFSRAELQNPMNRTQSGVYLEKEMLSPQVFLFQKQTATVSIILQEQPSKPGLLKMHILACGDSRQMVRGPTRLPQEQGLGAAQGRTR